MIFRILYSQYNSRHRHHTYCKYIIDTYALLLAASWPFTYFLIPLSYIDSLPEAPLEKDENDPNVSSPVRQQNGLYVLLVHHCWLLSWFLGFHTQGVQSYNLLNDSPSNIFENEKSNLYGYGCYNVSNVFRSILTSINIYTYIIIVIQKALCATHLVCKNTH